MFLRLIDAVRKSFAASEVATESGITIKDLAYGCDACRGKGTLRESMSFLPAVTQTCEACDGTGYRREVASLVERGRTLADIEALTIAELVDEWGDIDTVGRVGGTAMELGLGYLVVRQPGWSLSGGEAQRLKLAKALSRPPRKARSTCSTSRASDCTRRTPPSSPAPSTEIVDAGNTVLIVEHDPALLAACDWLIELGPGAGPDGGPHRVPGPTGKAGQVRHRNRPVPDRGARMNTLLLGDPSPSLQWRAATELEGIPSRTTRTCKRRAARSAKAHRCDRSSPDSRQRAVRRTPSGYILCQLAYLGYSGPEITEAVEALFTLQLPERRMGDGSEEDEQRPAVKAERC